MTNGTIQGTLSRDGLAEAVEHGEIDTVLTVFPDLYGRLMGKRMTGHFFVREVAGHGMHACDYLLACDMEMDPVPGYRFASWEKGYGDVHCVPDFGTLRRAAWLPRTAIVLCDILSDKTHEPVEVSPRRMLQRQLDRAREAGFTVMAGTEVELYAFDETYESARTKRYHDLSTVGSYIEDYHIFQGTKEEALIGAIRRGLDASGIPIEGTKGEWGPGQQELNLAYSEALAQADRVAIAKHACKEIAFSLGKAVTFMAKWDERFAGSGLHTHVSLWDGAGARSRFTGDAKVGPVQASEQFRWFLGGWIRYARELTAFYAPYVASYKRFQSGSFAPTGIAWSYDNRTAGFRAVGRDESLRIESRIAGADANPYIALAAAIAAGLEGIEKQIEPPEIFEGDIYQATDLPRVPATLREATAELERSEMARRVFGEEVVEHYLHFLRTEQRKFDEVVTSWERERFFERV